MPKELFDPEIGEQAKKAVRKKAELDTKWTYSELASKLYAWSNIFNSRFFAGVVTKGEDPLPQPVIGFDRTNIRTLAYYTLGKNAFGLDDEIIINTAHTNRPIYSILETLCHEQIHLWQQRRGKHPYVSGNNTHNAEFVAKAEAIGLHPAPIHGYHLRPADGDFRALLEQHGIKPPEDIKPKEAGKRQNWWDVTKVKGRSTLTKWECPACGLKIRVGVSQNVELACMPCSREYRVTVLLTRQ